VLFGGSVTTLGAGMAVDGWLVAEGHFLPFFPLEKWLRDTPTFVEHTHRVFGMLVGLCALAGLTLTFLRTRSTSARLGASAALFAVCLQGTLGGLRVLENDPRLAFLHGALAQAVFALLCVNAVLQSAAWREAGPLPAAQDELGALRSAALAGVLVVFGQVVLGAWYRHGLRPAPVESSSLRLSLHGIGALLVVFACARVMRRGAELRQASALPGGLARVLRAVPGLLLAQLVLGGLAWSAATSSPGDPAAWALSIAHVLGGALLLAAMAVAWAWTGRLSVESSPLAAAGLGRRPAWRQAP